jgi:hypothetical protein
LKNFFSPSTAISGATIGAMESGLTAADHAALLYLQLPACPASVAGGTSGSSICSDPATKAKIKSYEMQAYTAVKKLQADAANGTPAEMSEAETAISLYAGSIPAPSLPAAAGTLK